MELHKIETATLEELDDLLNSGLFRPSELQAVLVNIVQVLRARMERFWTPDRFMDVIEGVGEMQLKLLLAIQRKPGITSGELVTALGVKSEVALAGVLSGLSKQLKKMGIKPNNVFLIRVDWTGKSKTRSFLLDDFFVGAGVEQNWPDR